jgi:sodium/hydrogen exchanger 8
MWGARRLPPSPPPPPLHDIGEHAMTGLTHEHEHQDHLLAISIVGICILNVISLCAGSWLHQNHILWFPECGITIIIGFIVGMTIKSSIPPALLLTDANLFFDPTFFTLFLLPPIIFEAGYSLNMPLFWKNIGPILSLAIFGTLISTGVTWYFLYTDSTDWLIDLSFSESGQFAALISAVDPVATLAIFTALKVDPNLNSIVVGESVLNDAVALISFRAVTHYGINTFDEIESISLAFVITGVGSAAVGCTIGACAAFTFRVMGMGKQSHLMPHIECIIFVLVAYISFVGAELFENSGIVSSMFAGFTMRAYARPNLSAPARVGIDQLLKVFASLSENTVYLLVGLAITIELEYITNEDLEGTTLHWVDANKAFLFVIVLAVAVRAVHVFPILNFFNCIAPSPEHVVPIGQQVVCWFSGLRGAIAVALAYQVAGDTDGGTANNKHIIRAATMMVVVFTTFAFGGATPTLLSQMQVATNCESSIEEAKPAAGTIFKTLENLLVDPDVEAAQYHEMHDHDNGTAPWRTKFPGVAQDFPKKNPAAPGVRTRLSRPEPLPLSA